MKICVFCGSSDGVDPVFRQSAQQVGEFLARHSIDLVYGGGHVGLMGVVADAVLAGGGAVTGVMPKHLVEREIAHEGLTSLIVVEDMHERKAEMAARSDAFLSLPGGAGTLEEMFEQWTWSQLGLHQKPSGLLNVGGYYDPLLEMIRSMVTNGFLKDTFANSLVASDQIGDIVEAFEAYNPPAQKWQK